MDDRLKKLKGSMRRTVLQDLNFTEGLKHNIKNKINQIHETSEEDIILAVFQLLKQERTGFELSKLIRARGIKTFENEEGFLYMTLHKFEQKGYVNSYWKDKDVKYYQASTKGLRLLHTLDNKREGKAYSLKEILDR
ncbi:PadR family transcriptional regulator [Metabacillus malikii]|uniref:Transcription regulator PadR N-terminal domain-containing protein n=1 Tax=Metabacillus malikii TaxID=1504265 RepID=A0ABT9ZJ14_9BACI|nr:PadR family transcriptional regulator [Metabacillus malikii]MDQ0232261.1 hypothetical protein [Metabacillus malikii]